MTLEETTKLYAALLRQLLPVGGYDNSPDTTAAIDIYAHAKLLAQADLDGKRLLGVLEAIPEELINEYEAEYGLPLKCSVNVTKTFEERLNILNWVRHTKNVLNRDYLEQILAFFGVTLVDLQRFRPTRCTASCVEPTNTEQLRYKVLLRLKYPMTADMSCIIENYLPAYLRVDWAVDMPWGTWILNNGYSLVDSNIRYTAYKTNQHDYYDSYADFALITAIQRSLHNAEMQQSQTIKYVCDKLTGVTTWTFDNTNESVAYSKATNLYQEGKYRFKSTSSVDTWFIDPMDAIGFELQYFNQSSPSITHTFVEFTVTPEQWIADRSETILWTLHRFWYGVINDDIPNQQLTSEDNPDYNPNATSPIENISYLQIAQALILDASSSDQNVAVPAQAYLDNVANSIFNVDPVKQFVKPTDLFNQFEQNKILRI